MPRGQHILMLMSGSIACAKATGLISAWRQQGHQLRVAGTGSVANFVGSATLEGLSGHAVFSDTFAPGQVMDHIEWAQWADLVIACPASASLLGRLANGIADDAVTTLWQATWGREVAHVVVPAMNSHMWAYPANQLNVERLKDWGVHVLPTGHGVLACGEVGAGRMLEPEQIMSMVEALMPVSHEAAGPAVPTPPSVKKGRPGKRILVTGGGTREPIDAVRFLGNRSSGRTASRLLDELSCLGHEVDWLGAEGAIQPRNAAEVFHFETFDDLDQQLEELLGRKRYDLVVHAAAVSDFSLDTGPGSGNSTHQTPVHQRKISSGEPLSLQLRPNPKLLAKLRDYATGKQTKVLGFKLTVGADDQQASEAVERLFANGRCDRVVHNDWQDIEAGRHCFRIYGPEGDFQAVADVPELAGKIDHLLRATTGDSLS